MFTAQQKEMFMLNERKHAALIRGFFLRETMRDGLRLYHAGAVGGSKLEHENRFSADVRDQYSYHVTLRLDFLPHSRCQCKSSGSCRHMAATMLLYLRALDVQVEAFIEKAYMKSDSVPVFAPFSIPAEKESHPRTDLLTEHASYKEWHIGFRQLTEHLLHSDLQSRIDKVRTMLFTACEAWEDRQCARWYQLHALLYVMHDADQYIRKFGYFRSASLALGEWVHPLLHELTNGMDRKRLTDSPEDRRYVQGLADMLGQYAFAVGGKAINWLSVYRFIWSNFPLDQLARSAERTRLLNLAKIDSVSPERRVLLYVAAAHFLVLDGDETGAIREIEAKLEVVRPVHFYDYLEDCVNAEAWDRLRLWLNWLENWMDGASGKEWEIYFQFWRALVDSETAEHDSAELEKIMLRLLPQSEYYYSDYLLQNERMEMWVDFQLYMNNEPEYTEPKTLKYVASIHPQALLPYYHQRIMSWIEQKNRQSYQQAVRRMKKLRLIYRKLKQEAEWERYVQLILNRYSRLRALQEEMRKGKLIS